MQDGKVPTTPTISSIIAGVQCQEAVKLIHGMESLAGKGFVYNGVSCDPYIVEYQRKEECYSHDTAQSGLADCAAKLGRNFQLLLSDARQFLALGIKPFSQYADFNGKTGRREYLTFISVFLLTSCLLGALAEFLLVLGWCAYLVPILATTARRLRDTGLSPWMMLAVPLVPFLVLVPTVKEF